MQNNLYILDQNDEKLVIIITLSRTKELNDYFISIKIHNKNLE